MMKWGELTLKVAALTESIKDGMVALLKHYILGMSFGSLI
jgi:hypothetical protein